MKKILYVVPVLVIIVLFGFKFKVNAASEYYIHTDGYVYWMPDYTNFSTNNGLFKFSDFYECADNRPVQGRYFYDVNAMFSPGDVRKVEIYQDGGWYPLDSYEMSNNDWSIGYNADINDTGYAIISSNFNFFYQISDNTLTDDDLAGIRFVYDEETVNRERADIIYNFNLMNYPNGGALYDPSAYSSYNMFSQYLSVRFKSIDLEKIILMNNGVMPEIIFKVNGVENNFYPYDEFKLTMPIDKKIRDRTFLFHINEMYNKDLYMAFNFQYPEYLNEYHQYMLDKAEVDIRKLQVTIIFKDVLVDDEASIEELIQQAYNRGYSDGLVIGYEDAYNAGYDEGKRMGDILQYQYGYDAGYEDGLVTGNEDAYNSGYDAGFIAGAQESEAYNVGYADGANESFLGSMDKWLVPSIIIVMLLGGFFAIARKKRDGDI